MQTNFLEAVVNRRHTVLGRALHDFCIADALALIVAGNPLWTDARAPTMADLEEAVLICSLPPSRFFRADLAPRTLRERWQRRHWQLRASRADVAAALAEWYTYLADYITGPQFYDAPEGAGVREMRAPWLYSLVCFIEAHSNMSEAEVFAAPYGKMLWKAAAIGERLGTNASDIMTEADLAFIAERDAFQAAERVAAQIGGA